MDYDKNFILFDSNSTAECCSLHPLGALQLTDGYPQIPHIQQILKGRFSKRMALSREFGRCPYQTVREAEQTHCPSWL